MKIPNEELIFAIHGWGLWATWSVLGILQIATLRYFKCCHQANMVLHILIGILILFSTIALGVMMTFYVGEASNVNDEIHATLGEITIFTVGAIAAIGIISRVFMRSLTWKTKFILRSKVLHSILGYLLIFIS